MPESETNLAEVLAESFWNGWIPTDLPEDLLNAIELCTLGETTVNELHDLIETWQQSVFTGRSRGTINQVEGLQATLGLAYQQAMQVEPPEHEAIGYLLMTIQEGLQALINSCTAIITAMQINDWSIMHIGLHSAELAASSLQVVYDGTHFE